MRIYGYLHYEHIPTRGEEYQFRVADDNDNVVTSFATEQEARKYVNKFNKERGPQKIPTSWRGHPNG